MSVIIAVGGMHRSGTSMVARLLNLAGMYLGPEERLMPPASDNTEGFWEHLDFVELNDEILSLFKGGWDRVPQFPADWLKNPAIKALHEKARNLLEHFDDQDFWGWKDPRNSLTFDFWKQLIPSLKYLMVIRDPLEVARSLHERNGLSIINGLRLWEEYNAGWLNKTDENYVRVVHFEALLKDPEQQFENILKWAGIDYKTEDIKKATKGIKQDLRHQKREEIQFDYEENFGSVFELYRKLCEKAEYSPDESTSNTTETNENRESLIINSGTDRKEPLVSIIIPVFNKLELTHRCLKSILKNTRYLNYEIIFVDNGSTDDTRNYLGKIKAGNVRAVFNEENLGYVGGCNSGAAVAQGDYLLFLNNDTEVQPNWLLNMVRLAESREDAGIVGAKLVYPDGKLQEAGGIIFSDGNGWNYGRGLNPADPRFNFVRKVDYVSGAALMIKRSLWDKIGGFDLRYSPAYYEDTDLCFSVRREGYQVYYQPASVVIHYEGQTAGTDLTSGFKKYQQINHGKFVEKWQTELQKQWENKPENVPFASQRDVRLRILVADPFLPVWDKASGSLRLFNYLKILKSMDAHITFFARLGSTDPKYRFTLQQLGIEVYENDEKALKAAGYVLHKVVPPIPYEVIFKERAFDYAVISFWFLAEYYMAIIRKYSPKTRIIVDSVDIHFVRELRQAELNKDKRLKKSALAKKQRELNVYRKADRVWVVTEQDKMQIADKIGSVPIDVIPNIHQPVTYHKKFSETKDLLFVGNFAHPPNVDAIQYFVREIFPEIKQKLPEVKFYVVGSNPTPEIQKLNSDDIIVTGFVPELTPYLLQARVSVSPLRYGAGMKGKIGEALSYGLPVVTTSVGAEGMNLQHEVHALIADNAQDFAQEVVRLYNDQALWETLSGQGRALVENRWGPEAVKEKLQAVFQDDQAFGFARWPDVSIIMLTFNALEYTKKSVKSILEHTDIPYEIIFVDNGSTDGTVEYLQALSKQYPHIRVIFNKNNKGFAYGNNQGARKARGKYVLFLNNDVLVSDGWLADLVDAIQKNPFIGMVGPITNSISGLQRVEQIPYNNEKGFHKFAAQVRRVNKNKITPRRRIAGFCMLMPTQLFKKLNGFDKSFGTGNFEDDDLCLRVRYHEKRAIMVHEGVFIHHYGSQTFKANHIAYDRSMQDKARIFFKKWPNVDYEELLELKNPLSQEHAKHKEKITALLNHQEIEKAQELAKDILVENPLDLEARFYLALTFFYQNNIDWALEHAKIAYDYAPNDPMILNLLGQIFLAEKRYDEAEKTFNRALQIDPEFLEAKRSYAAVLIEKEDYAKGVEMLNQILKTNPNDVPTLIYLANLYLEAERPEEAAQYAQKVLQIDRENQLARKILEITGKSEEQTADQKQDKVHLTDGMQALQKGNAEQAIACFQDKLKDNPQDIEALYGTALALEMLEKTDEAKKVLQQILEIEMNFAPAWNDLARIYYQKGKKEKAADLFKKSLDIDENQITVRNQLCEVLLDLQRCDEAVALLKETRQKFPQDLPTLVHLARIMQKTGHEDEARQLWGEALEVDPENEAAREALEALLVPEAQD